MDNTAIEKYIALKQQISAMEKELETLKDEVFQAVDAQGGEIAAESYTIRSYKQPKYKFSADYDAKNQELKDLRKSEIENGQATIDGYSEYVKLNIKKAKE